MRAGRLDKRVAILKRTRIRDTSSGELVETFAVMGKVWANMINGRALERYGAQQKIAEATCGFQMRYAPALMTLTPDEHRLRYHDLEYEIIGVVEMQRREGVVALCRGRAEGLNALGQPPED